MFWFDFEVQVIQDPEVNFFYPKIICISLPWQRIGYVKLVTMAKIQKFNKNEWQLIPKDIRAKNERDTYNNKK